MTGRERLTWHAIPRVRVSRCDGSEWLGNKGWVSRADSCFRELLEKVVDGCGTRVRWNGPVFLCSPVKILLVLKGERSEYSE